MQAKLWKSHSDTSIQCCLCSHYCILDEEHSLGRCGVRQYQEGKLISLVGSKIIAHNIDPIEKKPLYHFQPQSQTFSFGSRGCNFDCAWCQNTEIAHHTKNISFGTSVTSESICCKAVETHCSSIAFTYNEPTVFFEHMLETAKLAPEFSLKSVLVSNGYQSPECLEKLIPFIHAANIDLKSFRDSTYQKYCKARLKPVLNTLKNLARSGVWLEVTTLIVPSVNDSEAELSDIAKFIANEIGTHIPWHLSAFYPKRNMLSTPATSLHTLERAKELAQNAGLNYVYTGNVNSTNQTICPHCNTVLLERNYYQTKKRADFSGTCPQCNFSLAGVWH